MDNEYKFQKAIWAASVLTEKHYRGFDFWVVEHTTINRVVLGNVTNHPAIAKMPCYQSGIEEQILVIGGLGINTKLTWWEAVVIAEALSEQKYLD